MRRARLILPLAAVLAHAAIVATAAAQSVVGTVVDGISNAAIAGVEIHLLDPFGRVAARAESDVHGDFMLVAPRSGVYGLVAQRLGYTPIRTDSLPLAGGERISLELRMAVEAVPIEAIVVTSRVDASGDLAGFYSRMDRGQRAGFGHYISLQQIERSAASSATDLLRLVPGVRVVSTRRGPGGVVRMAGNCAPALFIDGIQINRGSANESLDDYVNVFSIEGIEVYRGASQQVLRFHDPRGCGVILVWTKRGQREPGEFSWKKLLIGLGLIGVVILLR